MARSIWLWFDQWLGQGPTYALHVGWALAQDHCKYLGNSGSQNNPVERMLTKW